jgi:hypothetical protein
VEESQGIDMTPEHLPNPDKPEVQNIEIDAKLYEQVSTHCQQIGLKPSTLLNAIVEEYFRKREEARLKKAQAR